MAKHKCIKIGKAHFLMDTYPGTWILGIRIQPSVYFPSEEYTQPAHLSINLLWLKLAIVLGCGLYVIKAGDTIECVCGERYDET